MTLLKHSLSVLTLPAVLAMGFLFSGVPAHANNLTSQFDSEHKICLERIAEDPELAYEEAMIWRDNGGGRRAKHCEAMALFGVGQTEEAAYRLNQLCLLYTSPSPRD